MSSTLLREALQKKGIGPKGSKKLPPSLLAEVLPTLQDANTNVTTATAFLTACLTLENTVEEQALLDPILQAPEQHLIPQLQELVQPPTVTKKYTAFLELTQQLMQNQDLHVSQAQQGMELFWKEEIPSWLKASFLQALRLKRETFVENFVFLDSLWKKAQRLSVDVPILLDLADSYDGTNRSYHLAPFIAPLLASMGIPTVIHGTDQLAPKYGITNSQILQLGKKNTLYSLKELQHKVENPHIGWAYVDQSIFFPELHRLHSMRHDMVKRPFLATFEKLLQPLQAKNGNILIAGYVHSHYKEEVAKLLASHHQTKMMFNLRTIEGSSNCWIKKSTPYFGFRTTKQIDFSSPRTLPLTDSWTPDLMTPFFREEGFEFEEGEIDPKEFDLFREDQKINKEISAQDIYDEGLLALEGKQGLIQDLLIYHASMFAWLARCLSKEEAVAKATHALHTKKALQHWKAF